MSSLSPLSPYSLSFSPEDVESLATKAIAEFKGVLDSLSSSPEPTFSSLLVPLSQAEVKFTRLHSLLNFPQYVSSSSPLRDASSAADKRLSEFLVDVNGHLPLFRALQKLESAYADSEKEGGEREAMEAEDTRYLQRWLLDFRRNGMALSEEDRDKVIQRKKRESELCIDFQKNLNEDTSSHSFTREELTGLPDDFIDALEKEKRDGEGEGEAKYILTCKYPHVIPTLRQCKVENTRRVMEGIFNNICKEKNTKIAEEVFSLRHETAQLLGYPTWADYILEVRMAKDTHTVKGFYEMLIPKLNKLADEEMRVLLDLKKEEVGAERFDGVLNAWDSSYYSAKLLRENYGVDEEHIKHYFPADKVIPATLQIYQELLSVKFEALPNAPIWHEEVQCYQVFDRESSDLLGYFYMDLHPREGKYGHAAAFPLQGGCLDEHGKKQVPISAMVCNFPKSTQDTPALLRHSDFVTFFHEFGHIMHGILGHTKYCRFSGTSTERDFVECPSQTLENFCYEKEILHRVSSHHATGEKLPDDLIDKMIKAKKVGAGLLNLRQAFFGLFDQTVHSQAKVDSEELYGKMRTEITRIVHTKGTNPTASFGHLLGGYDASYYGYLWAEVFSSDVFSVFKKNGIMDPITGMKYRQCILSPGGREDASHYLLAFLGRKPNQDAFLEDIGVEMEH